MSDERNVSLKWLVQALNQALNISLHEVFRHPEAVDCRAFKLSTRQARRYLQRAKAVDPASAHSTLDWSPCYASGTVSFVDGGRAQWTIASTRVGSLIFEGQPEQRLYCPKCIERPFVR